MFFDCWEYKTNNEVDSNNLRIATRNMIFTEIREEALKKTISERPFREWLKLYLRRALLITFNFAFICGCAAAIIYTNINK